MALIHARTTRNDEMGASFPATLVLLSILIAMVTQVIGDNVARAFSLVGALSIVRFRTVVRDTRDTAFVIFAVVAGMAMGAGNVLLAAIGLLTGGAAAFLMWKRGGNGRTNGDWTPDRIVRVRGALGMNLSDVAGRLGECGVRHRLAAVGTAKQATMMEAEWEVVLNGGKAPEELVRDLGRVDGVQDVSIGWFGLGRSVER